MGAGCAARCTEVAESWQLYKSNSELELEPVGSPGTISGAARRIIVNESLSVDSLTFQLHVPASFAPDDRVLNHLEYKGRHAFYVIKRLLVADAAEGK